MLYEQKQKQLTRAAMGRELVGVFRDIIRKEKPDDAVELLIYSERINLCNQPSNIFIAKDFVNKETGEYYDASGRFWNCNSKLCPSCVRRSSIRNRKITANAVEQQKLFVGENFKLITLTMPRTSLGLLDVRSIMNYAWTLFRKRQWFKQTIIGGAKSEEFTVNRVGFHYHIHALVRAKYINWDIFRAEWTTALDASFAKHNVNLSFSTRDGLANANVKHIDSIKSAIYEVSKYITKSDSFAKLKPKDLLDIARIRRFPRMFEVFGSFKIPVLNVIPEEAIANVQTPYQNYLDKKNLSDGETEPIIETGWRKRLRRVGVTKYLSELRDEINAAHHFRRHQLKFGRDCTRFWRLNSDFNYDYDQIILLIKKTSQRCAQCGYASDHSDVPDDLGAKALVIALHRDDYAPASSTPISFAS